MTMVKMNQWYQTFFFGSIFHSDYCDEEELHKNDDDDDYDVNYTTNGGSMKVFVFANKICKIVEVNLYGFWIFASLLLETFYFQN